MIQTYPAALAPAIEMRLSHVSEMATALARLPVQRARRESLIVSDGQF